MFLSRVLSLLGLTSMAIGLSMPAHAAITARVTYNTHADYLATGNPAPGQLVFFRSDTANAGGNYGGVANNNNARLDLSGNVTNAPVNLGSTAGHFTVLYNHANAGQAQYCTTSPINFFTSQYLSDGQTIDVTVTCQAPDTQPPTLVSAASSTDGTDIVTTWSEEIDFSFGELSDFTLRQNGVPVPLTGYTHSGSSLTLHVSPALAAGTTLTLDYTDAGGLNDASYNAAQSFNGRVVTNNVVSTAPPVVSDARISISGASGTGGAYKIGDTVTATWNNTAGGDNNTSTVTAVTVDFSQFGGGAAVAATNSSGVWTATYTLTAGAIDATSRNVSVTATNAYGSTTTADTTNATVDTIAPTVTDGRISISGASGTGGAYKIGDTVTATWNNTAGGDNNTDTISSVTVNFTQFGGGAAVAATNSAGTWTATYTVVAGAIDMGNRNVTVTATDNAGNVTATSDTSNATVDNIAPTVSSIVVSGSPGSGDTAMAFTVNFSESVANVSTDDFTLVGTGSAAASIASVSASSGSAINVNIGGISGTGTLKVNLNGGTNVVDDVGNTVAGYSAGQTHSVNILTAPQAPTIGAATAGDGQVSVAFTAPVNNGGSAITGYTVTSNPGSITAGGNGFTTSPITVTGLTNGTAYTFTVTATNAVGTSTASGASGSATPKGNQTITFTQPTAQSFGSSPTLAASATSGLAVSFSSSTTGVCTTTTGGELTFVTAGSCTINVDQAGNGAWNAASQVSRTFTVNAVVPGAPTIGTAVAGDSQADVSFTAPASNGGATITGYTVTSNPGGFTGTGAGSPITVAGLTNGVSYTFTVTATNSAGTGAASGVSNSITPASPQTITFANPGTQTFGTAPDLSILGGGASSTSGLTVTFTSATTGVCTITSGGELTFITAGSCTINADQAGNSGFLPAAQVQQTFTVAAVAPGAPTIGTATADDGQASVAFTAPVDTGGTTITGYTVTVSPADVAPVSGASSPILVTGLTNGAAYTFTVTATNGAGTGPASAASGGVTPIAGQTITFNDPGAQSFGTSPDLSILGGGASSTSGLTVTFTSSTSGVCTVTSGGILTFVSAGTCTINADQAGNASYLAADRVSRSFAVTGVAPGAPVIGTATVIGAGQVAVSFTAPSNTGGEAITSYTVTSSPGGLSGTGSASPITVSGLAPGTSYTFTVTATNSAGTGAPSAVSNLVTPVPTQVITFANPGAQDFGTRPVLDARADSGLPLRFSVSTPAVCSVGAGGVLDFTGIGTCTITAEQPGNGQYAAATPVTQTFAVVPVAPGQPDIQTLTPVGSGRISVAFTPPAFTGGAPITGYQVTATPRAGVAARTLARTAAITTSAAGVVTATGSGSPIVVAGLTDGVAYVFTVLAINQVGQGPVDTAVQPVVAVPDLRVQPVDVAVAYGADATAVTLDIVGAADAVVIVEAPEHGTAVASGTGITYQPKAGYAGPDRFTYAARDSFQTSVAAAVQVQVAVPAVVLETTGLAAITLASPYRQVLASSGGAAPYAYRVSSGTLPAGLTLGEDGVLAGTATAVGEAAFEITVTDSSTGTGPFSASQRYTLSVVAAVPVITWDETLSRTYGEADFELALPQSTSPGTFTFSSSNTAVATVTGRTVRLVGEGSTVITASQAATGSYAAAAVQLQLSVAARPDPTADREVASAIQAQADASVRFAQVQSGNIRDRLRQVRTGTNASSFNVAMAYAGSRGVPGMSVPLNRAGDSMVNALPRLPEGWGAWAAGTATFGKAGRGSGGFDFNTGGITVGADRAIGEHVLLGVAGSWGRQDTDFDHSPSSTDADQRSLAVYGLWRAGEHVFFDAMLASGRLDFELTRWSELAGASARGSRGGEQLFGSLTFGYEHRSPGGTTLTSYGRYDGHRAELDAYREHGLDALDLAYGRQDVDTSSLALGLEGTHAFKGERVSWRPHWSVEYRTALENRSDVAVNYVQRPTASDYVLAMRSYNDDALSVGAGVDLQFDSGWMVSLLLGHEQGRNSLRSNSIGLQVRYGSQGGQGGRGRSQVDANGIGDRDGERLRCRTTPGECIGPAGGGIQP